MIWPGTPASTSTTSGLLDQNTAPTVFLLAAANGFFAAKQPPARHRKPPAQAFFFCPSSYHYTVHTACSDMGRRNYQLYTMRGLQTFLSSRPTIQTWHVTHCSLGKHRTPFPKSPPPGPERLTARRALAGLNIKALQCDQPRRLEWKATASRKHTLCAKVFI